MADPLHKLAQLTLAQRWLRLAAQIEMNAETQDDAPLVPSQANTICRSRMEMSLRFHYSGPDRLLLETETRRS